MPDILLRPLETHDKSMYFYAIHESKKELGEWLPWCHKNYDWKDVDAWFFQCAVNWAENNLGNREFGIFDKYTGELFGGIGLKQLDDKLSLANLGYWVRTSQVGKGVATSAVAQILPFAFTDLPFQTIEISAILDNHASRKVAEKAGFANTGLTRKVQGAQAQLYDAAIYHKNKT